MGEETVTEVTETAENGSITPEQKVDDAPMKKEEEMNGVKDMEEDVKDDQSVATKEMGLDQHSKENEEEKKEVKEEKMEEAPSEAIRDEMEAKENKENTEKVEVKMHELKDEGERAEENQQVKESKRHGKRKAAALKAKNDKKEVEKKEKKTPVASAYERPVRERKSVERLVACIEKESGKEIHIGKGRGTALKDIPNVAYKLSKRKIDDTYKLLHTILFGRRAKVVQIKSNISRFSGFVWTENEEKQKMKVKEKLDKCVKEKLLEFCDLLDIPISKATSRKEDIVTNLIDFLVAPHATTSELLAEKEQSSKGKKRKRVVKRSASVSGSTPSKSSAKSHRKSANASKDAEKNNTPETEDESNEEEEEEDEKDREEEENESDVPQISKNEVPELSESEESKDEDDSEEDTGKGKNGSKKISAKKESTGRAKTKKVAPMKKSSPPPKRTPGKSSSNRSNIDHSSDTSPKTFSRKKRTEVVKEKSTPKRPASKEKTGKKVVKGKVKPKEDKLKPSDKELRSAICEILKEVDFNTATFTDILKQLAKRFNMDLTSRKSSIKLMIQDELTKLAEEADDEEDEGDAEKDGRQPSSQGVEA